MSVLILVCDCTNDVLEYVLRGMGHSAFFEHAHVTEPINLATDT